MQKHKKNILFLVIFDQKLHFSTLKLLNLTTYFYFCRNLSPIANGYDRIRIW